MLLRCSSCMTRYLIDPAQLGAEGRNVRCGKCGHIWHQAPHQDKPRQIDPIPISIEPRPIPPGSNLPAFRPPPKPRGQGIAWAVLALVVAAVIGGAYLARERIVALWPPAAKIYALAELKPKPIEETFKIRNVVPSRAVDNGVQVLVVQGEVVNISKEIVKVPPLLVVLRDARARDVLRWPFTVAEPKLVPGEVTKFSTMIKNPSSEATEILVDFAPGGKG